MLIEHGPGNPEDYRYDWNTFEDPLINKNLMYKARLANSYLSLNTVYKIAKSFVNSQAFKILRITGAYVSIDNVDHADFDIGDFIYGYEHEDEWMMNHRDFDCKNARLWVEVDYAYRPNGFGTNYDKVKKFIDPLISLTNQTTSEGSHALSIPLRETPQLQKKIEMMFKQYNFTNKKRVDW